jgi:hypothetical protein
MPSLNLIIALSATSDNFCDYYPKEAPIDLVERAKEIAFYYKSIPSTGTIISKQKKYYYMSFTELNKQDDNKERLFVMIVGDINYSDNMFESLHMYLKTELQNDFYINSKLSGQTKQIITTAFKKFEYTNIGEEHKMKRDDSSQNNNGSMEMVSKKDIVSFDTEKENSNMTEVQGVSIITNHNEPKKEPQSQIKEKIDIDKEKEIHIWKKTKFIYMIIFSVFIIFGGISLPIVFSIKP